MSTRMKVRAGGGLWIAVGMLAASLSSAALRRADLAPGGDKGWRGSGLQRDAG